MNTKKYVETCWRHCNVAFYFFLQAHYEYLIYFNVKIFYGSAIFLGDKIFLWSILLDLYSSNFNGTEEVWERKCKIKDCAYISKQLTVKCWIVFDNRFVMVSFLIVSRWIMTLTDSYTKTFASHHIVLANKMVVIHPELHIYHRIWELPFSTSRFCVFVWLVAWWYTFTFLLFF